MASSMAWFKSRLSCRRAAALSEREETDFPIRRNPMKIILLLPPDHDPDQIRRPNTPKQDCHKLESLPYSFDGVAHARPSLLLALHNPTRPLQRLWLKEDSDIWKTLEQLEE